MKQGYVQVYTGDGKGKTTAALGLALRASGHGLKSYIGQFMKGRLYGELAALQHYPRIKIEQYGEARCIRLEEVTERHREQARRGLARGRAALVSGDYDLVVLDEVSVALLFGLLELAAVLAVIEARPPQVELVLTGRRAPPEILERASLVTEMREVKHYYACGVEARPGIEW